MTVYISNMAPAHDYSTAEQYGAVRPVTSGNFPVFKTGRLLDEISSVLLSSTEEDYLVCSGSSFVAALCLAVWLTLHRECRVLLFDREQSSYVPRTLRREQIATHIERERDRLEKRKVAG